MPAITRDVVFGKLGETSMQTLQSAFAFARLRGDAYIEPVHWIQQWLRDDGCDAVLILDRLGLSRTAVTQGLEHFLGGLQRSRSSRLDFSADLELMVERGWISTSLRFGAPRMRTGHLLHALAAHPELRRLLLAMAPGLRGLDAEALAERFADLTSGSAEEAAELTAAAAAPAPAGAEAATRPEEALERYTTDLTEQARAGKIDPVIGRDREIREVIDILMRRRQNNPIIVGEAGVGKTALVEGLAQRIAGGDVPPALAEVRLLSLDLAAMQAGAAVRGEFEDRLKRVIEEVRRAPRPVVLFIDEAHTLIGAGGAAGTGDAANLLKPALARGELRTIAATTWAEYKEHIEKDAALTRRFQPVLVDEPDEDTAVRMVRGMAAVFAAHHGVDLRDEAIAAAVRLSRRYIQGRQLPDKAVSVLDTACARVAMALHATPAELEDCRRRIADLEVERDSVDREARIGADDAPRRAKLDAALAEERTALATLEQRFATESRLVAQVLGLRQALLREPEPGADEAEAIRQQLQDSLAELRAEQGEQPLLLPSVDAQVVASVIEGWTGIPVGRMLSDEIDAVLRLKDTLRRRIVGQDHALDAIVRRLETAGAGLEDPRKPKGVFLLVGPSGVGKTETGLALADALFGGEDHSIIINMSEFQEPHTVSTLKGAPPGYVGYGRGGRLTEAVRRKPYSVVLLDEIEKAHPDVHELFFQVFDKGSMEDGEGRRIDFRNTLILLTTNAGSELLMRLCADPDRMPTPETLEAALRGPLLEVFPPALLGRLTVVPYLPLSEPALDRIIRLQLDRFGRRITEVRGVPFSYDDAVVEQIRARCTEIESGGRMVEAILAGSVMPAVSREILGRLRDGRPMARVALGAGDGGFTYAFD
jgi:type VI secretion system protein VasG